MSNLLKGEITNGVAELNLAEQVEGEWPTTVFLNGVISNTFFGEELERYPDNDEHLLNYTEHGNTSDKVTIFFGNKLKKIDRLTYGFTDFTSDVIIPNGIPDGVKEIAQNSFGYVEPHFPGDLIIPDSITDGYSFAFSSCDGDIIFGKGMSEIPRYAFNNFSFNGTLNIPDHIKKIDSYGFQYNSSITSFNISANNSVEIASLAFWNCTNLYLNSNITLSSNISSLGFGAFLSTGISSVTLDETFDINTILSKGSFDRMYNCSSFIVNASNTTLKSTDGILFSADDSIIISYPTGKTDLNNYTIPSTVTRVDNSCFSETTVSLVSNSLPSVLEEIGDRAFYKSSIGGDLIIPNSVTSIERYAFYDCNGLDGSLTLPNNLQSLGYAAFSSCEGITGTLTIPSTLNEIGEYSFSDCSGFDTLIIENGVSIIGKFAFEDCSGFTGTLTIPNSISAIRGSAFHDCSGFTGDLVIPSGVIEIGEPLEDRSSNYNSDYGSFAGCTGLNGSLNLPEGLETIGQQAFQNCSLTGSLNFPSTLEAIGKYAFQNNGGFTGSLNLPSSLTDIREYAFQNCSGLTGALTIPNSVTFDRFVFDGCSGFSSLVIENGVTQLERGIFQDCSGLTGTLTIPNSVTFIDAIAFDGCSGFTGSLIIPNSVTSMEEGFSGLNIASGVFGNCSFTSVTLPSGITRIPSGFMVNCTNLSNINYNNAAITEIGSGAFDSCGLTGTLTIPDGVTTIENGAFTNTGITSLVLPSSIKHIGNNSSWNFKGVFTGCSALTGTLTLPEGLETIGRNAFQNCSLTGSLVFPSTLKVIDHQAFDSSLGGNGSSKNNFTGAVIIPEGVTILGDYAFRSCLGITSLTIPSTIIDLEIHCAFGDILSGVTSCTNVNLYLSRDSIDVSFNGDPIDIFNGSSVSTLHVRAGDTSWTAGGGQTISGKSGITVIKDLPNIGL